MVRKQFTQMGVVVNRHKCLFLMKNDAGRDDGRGTGKEAQTIQGEDPGQDPIRAGLMAVPTLSDLQRFGDKTAAPFVMIGCLWHVQLWWK